MNESDLDTLAFHFFKLFAQFESTLKERGFFGVVGDRIRVDWVRFANEVVGPQVRVEYGDGASAADFILNQPPMKQAVNDLNQIVWLPVGNDDKSVQALFGHICRIRNNLFHGAKFNGTWFDPRRSRELLSCALVVLESYRPWLSAQGDDVS